MSDEYESYLDHQAHETPEAVASQQPLAKLPVPAVVMLCIYTTINLLSYFDRGLLSACLSDIRISLPNVNGAGEGLLASAFMVGYMIGSPFFAHCATIYEPFRIMAVGLFMWAVATMSCAFSVGFWSLISARTLTGFGEASFLCIAPPFIDKFAPASSKSLWLSVFYTAIPVGYATGFGVSGPFLSARPFGDDSWRYVFGFESFLMIPFIVFCLFGKSPYSFRKEDNPHENNSSNELDNVLGIEARGVNGSTSLVNSYNNNTTYHSTNDSSSQLLIDNDDRYNNNNNILYRLLHSSFAQRIRCLFRNKLYLTGIFGYAAQTFVTGGFAFYGLDYAKEELKLTKEAAGLIFGGVTLFAGIFGTLTGGIVLDLWRRKAGVPSSLAKPPSDEELAYLETLPIEEQHAYKLAQESKKHDLRDPNVILDRLHSIRLSYKLCIATTVISFPFALMAFFVSTPWLFGILMLIAEFTLFLCFSPLNNAVMWSVPFNLAPQAMAFSVVAIHLLGDALSPPVISLMLDITDKEWRTVMLLSCLPLSLAIFSWALGMSYATVFIRSVRGYIFNDNPILIDDSILSVDNHISDQYTGLSVKDNAQVEFALIRRNLHWDRAEQCK